MEYYEDDKINNKVFITKTQIDLVKFVFCTKKSNICFILRKIFDFNKKKISTFVFLF